MLLLYFIEDNKVQVVFQARQIKSKRYMHLRYYIFARNLNLIVYLYKKQYN